MATTIDYGGDYENPSATIFHGMNDYGKGSSDYQTTMSENPSGAIDYDSLTRGKLCPMKASQVPLLAFWNMEPDLIGLKEIHINAVKIKYDGYPPRVEYIGGRCDGPRCAWWDAHKERCAVLSTARKK